VRELAIPGRPSEEELGERVDALAGDPESRRELRDLLREEHPIYEGRGAAAVVRMRGWILLALGRIGLEDADLPFVLEELDAGTDAYLVAAAARALRAYPRPGPVLAPFVMRALANIRYRDEPVCFGGYGEYAVGGGDTTPVLELLAALAWLGPHARESLPELESLRAERGGTFRKRAAELERALTAIRGDANERAPAPSVDACCVLPGSLGYGSRWGSRSRRGEPIGALRLEDQAGEWATFGELFRGHPSIVAFFYTRCDNPLKCSLTVSKLGRVQKLLESRGVDELIHTAAITYDPAFDLAERMRGYGQNRGLRMDAAHRVLRAPEGMGALSRHFALGVNFVGSLVNRHRIEIFVLDREGRVAAAFERIHWDEREVVARAVEVLEESEPSPATPPKPGSQLLASLAALGIAFFPKCPICWAAYLGAFGIAGLSQVPYSPWLLPLLAAAMVASLAAMWFRGRATRRMGGFYLAALGAVAIAVSRIGPAWQEVALWGAASTLAGSLWSAVSVGKAGLRNGRGSPWRARLSSP